MKKKSEMKELADQILKGNKIKSYEDLSSLMGDLQSTLLQTVLDAELDCHLGYEKGSHTEKENENRRNGYVKEKTLKTKTGELKVKTPRDRKGTFEPVIVPKKQTMLDSFEDIAISCYAKGMSLRDMEKLFQDIYQTNFNKEQLTYLISKVNKEVKEWQTRKLKPIYAFMYIDCLYVPIKEEFTSKKKAIYVIIGIDLKGKKEVVGVWIGGNESTSYWVGILEEIQKRGVEDILFLSLDGLTGLSEAICTVYPKTITQRCIVHLTRNLYQICPKKKAKEIIQGFKKIYQSSNKEEAILEYENFVKQYQTDKNIIKKVTDSMQHIYSLMEYPMEIRKIIYTTNPIESVNSCLRKVTRGKGSFPNEESVMKILYLRIKELEKKWTRPIPNWDKVSLQLSILFEDRLSKYLDN